MNSRGFKFGCVPFHVYSRPCSLTVSNLRCLYLERFGARNLINEEMSKLFDAFWQTPLESISLNKIKTLHNTSKIIKFEGLFLDNITSFALDISCINLTGINFTSLAAKFRKLKRMSLSLANCHAVPAIKIFKDISDHMKELQEL